MSLDEHHAAGPEHQLERLIFFSDAVFAIAITLLVIELRPPHLPYASPDRAYGMALLELLPSILGFAVSFFVIGAFWAGHHRAFALAQAWDDRLIAPNLQMLFTVAAMPFVTAFMSANPTGRVPAMLYAAGLLLLGVCNIRIQRLVTRPPIVHPHAPRARIQLIRRRGLGVIFASIITFVLAAIVPYPGLAMLALTTIPLWRILLTRMNWLGD